MGCDAHPVIEVYDEEKGIWVANQSERFQDYEDTPQPVKYLGSRSYVKFSILADVRNHYEESQVDPLFPQRGLPDDASDHSVQLLNVDWAGDIHSVTHFTLKELLEVDWDDVACLKWHVQVFGDTYQYVMEHGELPKDWEESWGGERKHVNEAEMQLMLVGGAGHPTEGPTKLTSPYWRGRIVKHGPVVEVVVPGTYRQMCPSLTTILIPELQKLGKPEHVRVVMGFDN